ncbi:hypothetical protein ULMS_25910 [Patiriisocius marinistellae]|uniref:DUF4846 domain-containing protein n=2 Tax=Patiriisocius marinistellae TaxID=2494560 RepID=A0A5J4FYG5_9FLAO|nr:hypothetical protein ULMS_25910 [Patiriisocius marinistellae]
MPINYINEAGLTVSNRIKLPKGYTRTTTEVNSFASYLQDYILKPFGAPVINYDGNPYIYQSGHVGILEIPVPSNGLQQCADALMRIRAEYLWDNNRKGEIGFNFTSGHYCNWSKYAEGYRPKVNGNKVTFKKRAAANYTKQNFYKYLNLIYTYSGTQSLFDELPPVNAISKLQIGDMLIKPGSPGHVIMIVDIAENRDGNRLFIFAQGNTPAQSVHIIKNPNDTSISPWFELEMNGFLEIPTYYFNDSQFMRFK